MRKLAVLLFLVVGASSCLAARKVTVEQLEELLAGAGAKPDGKIAQQLSELELTERLSAAKISQLALELPGAQSRRSLVILADMAAFRSLPVAEIPSDSPPDLAAQRKMLAKTVNYAEKTVSSLPNFFATRETTRFENSPLGHLVGTSLIPYQPLHVIGTSAVSVLYRDGREVIDTGVAKNRKGESASQGLSTRGVFGPILGTVLVDVAQGRLGWSHWEQGTAGAVAVFRYSIPKEKSHYQVEFCCVRDGSPNGLFQELSGYHGYLAVDPTTGAILRLTIEADLRPSDPILRSDAAVEYGPVEISGNTYICPTKSISILVSPPLDQYGFATAKNDASFTDKEGSTLPESVQIWLNDAVFDKYHVFRADTRLMADNSGSSAERQPSAAKSAALPNAGLVAPGTMVSKDEAEKPPVAEAPAAAPASAPAEKTDAMPRATPPPSHPAAVGLPASEITVTAATALPDTPAASSSDRFSLRVNARLVDIAVVANDKKGHPLTGLKQEDFEIYDNGRKQSVRFFSRVGDEPATAQGSEVAAPQPLYSNHRSSPSGRTLGNGAEATTTILLLDASNLAWADLTNARGQMLHFLQALPAGELAALYLLQGNGFQVLVEATWDHALLAAKLSQWAPTAQDLAGAQEMEAQNRQQFDEVRNASDLQSVNGNTGSSADTASTVDPKLLANGRDPTRIVLPALANVARHLAAIPGHKNLVWVSSDNVLADWSDRAVGADKGPKNINGPILAAQEALNDSHVSLYPLDASQLETMAVNSSLENMNITVASGAMQAPTPQGGADKTGRLSAEMNQDQHPVRPAIQEMAAATGGRAFRRSSDMAAELNGVIADGHATYLLSFTPDTPADDQYHLVTVKIAGQKGVTLRYRTGYLYTKDPTTLKDRLRQAISQPLDVNEISVSARPVETPLGATLKLNMATNDLALKQQAERWTGKLDIFLVQREDSSTHARVSGQTIALNLLPATYQKAQSSGVPFDQLVEREQKTGLIRIVVVDEGSGRIGSVTVPAIAMQGKWH